MPNTNTKIRIKRSDKTQTELSSEPLNYGEPIFFETSDSKNKFLAIGNDVDTAILSNATFFEGIINTDLIGKTVFANSDNVAVIQDKNANGTYKVVKASDLAINKLELKASNTNNYSLVLYGNDNKIYSVQEDLGIYVTGNGVLCGAAWNDYAETRKCISGKPGQVVCEVGDGTLALSERKLQALPYVITDTCGITVGVTNEIDETFQSIAVAGRTLVYVNCDVEIGDVLCADRDGFATVMNRHEISLYPDRILGIVSEIPNYEKWNDKIDVDGRVWVTIK